MLCDACKAGDHSHHHANLGGICIGCTCPVSSPSAPELTPQALPDGDIFMISDRVILLDSFESVAGAGSKMGEEGVQPMILVTLAGRRNGGHVLDNVTVALSPEDARRLCDTILHSVGSLPA